VAAAARFTRAVEQQLEVYPNHNLIIVTHGTVLTLFLCQHNPDMSPWQLWQSLTMPCAFIVSLPNMRICQSLFMPKED
jgi:broad specificity phosphatase PhoE